MLKDEKRNIGKSNATDEFSPSSKIAGDILSDDESKNRREWQNCRNWSCAILFFAFPPFWFDTWTNLMPSICNRMMYFHDIYEIFYRIFLSHSVDLIACRPNRKIIQTFLIILSFLTFSFFFFIRFYFCRGMYNRSMCSSSMSTRWKMPGIGRRCSLSMPIGLRWWFVRNESRSSGNS